MLDPLRACLRFRFSGRVRETRLCQLSAFRNKARRRHTPVAAAVEAMEQRVLLTGLVGIDLGGGGSPINWTNLTGTTDTQLDDRLDESGDQTGIDVFVDFDTSPDSFDTFTPPASQLPSHTQSLAGLNGNYFDVGNIEFTYSDLAPGQDYNIYVFGGDTGADHQQVTITGATVTTFNQQFAANQLFINRTVGDSTLSLSSYAEMMTADVNGEILVRIDSSPVPGGFFGLAGIAIEPAAPPPEPVFVDNGGAGFSTNGAWTVSPNAIFPTPEGRDGDIHHAAAGDGSKTATWTFTGLTPGNYQVAATWSTHANRATNAPFTIFDGTAGPVLDTAFVNQEQLPDDFNDDGSAWEELAIVTITGSELVVQLSNAADQYVIADGIRIVESPTPPPPPAMIIDDGDAGFATSGAWNKSPIAEGRLNDVRTSSSGNGSDVATWTFTGLAPGNYRVSATWSTHANRATDAPYSVRDGAGGEILERVLINQELAPDDFNDRGSDWEELTVVTITSGTLVVELSDDANQYVIADAIRIEPTMQEPLPPGIIVDNEDEGFATLGAWNVSPLVEGHDGTVRTSQKGDGSSIATWTFTGLTPGVYRVSATWSTHANRATNAPYEILDGTGGSSFGTVQVDQEQAPDDFTTFGSDWEDLMTVSITGSELVVTLNNAANEYVIADAIRIQEQTLIPI